MEAHMHHHPLTTIRPRLIAFLDIRRAAVMRTHAMGGAPLSGVLGFGMCVLLLSACCTSQHSDAMVKEPCRVSGRVVDADGRALPSALVQVLWSRTPTGAPYMLNGLSMFPKRLERHEFARGTTDASGAFTLSLPAWFASLEKVALLVVSKQNHGVAIMYLASVMTSAPKLIVLPGEERVTGKITDEFGIPVAGARVALRRGDIVIDYTYSDEHGCFSIGKMIEHSEQTVADNGSPQGNASALASSPEASASVEEPRTWACRIEAVKLPWLIYVSRSPNDLGEWAVWPESGIPLRITLPRGYSQTIRILDAANRPLRNEQVWVTGIYDKRLRLAAMLTDGDGVIVVDGITEKLIAITCGDSGSRPKGPPDFEYLVIMDRVRQIPLEVVDVDTGVSLSDIVICPPEYPMGCAFLGSDCWRSGNNVTFQIGQHDLCFMTDGYEPWHGRVSIERDTQSLTIRLKKLKAH